MRFLILGGSGRSGKLVIDEAIQNKHQVVALVRSHTSLKQREGLEVVEGSPMSVDDISNAIASSSGPIDAIIITLNARRVSDSPFAALHPDSPPNFISTSVENVITAMHKASPPVKKVVLMSSVGTGESMNNVNFLMRGVFSHTNMRISRDDHELADKALKSATGIDFVEVRPWMLAEGDAAAVKVYGDDGKGAGFMPKITRASVAKFIVEAAATTKYNGKSPVITN